MTRQPSRLSEFEDCWLLTGPTAGGKTAVGIELAQRIGAEIVSVDSMALYRGMDIGTAKPTRDERELVRHHLIDALDPHEEASVAWYVDAARAAADDIRRRGRAVLFVGGTPLYLKALTRGLFDGPPADWQLRQQLKEWADQAPPGALHARLAAVDSVAAGRLHPHDTRRLVRALEVYELTGRPISQWQTQFERQPAPQPRWFALAWPRETLGQRIDQRVDAMFAAGLVDETAALLAAPQPPGKTARQAVGYREVIAHLQGGLTLDETVALVKTKTRQFAKRQLTWFRSLPEFRQVSVPLPLDPRQLAEQLHVLASSG